MSLLFNVPGLQQRGVTLTWRCAGCDARVRGVAYGLPTFCAFCREWARWRREGDDVEARLLETWEDDGGRVATYRGRDKASQ
jgi:hypothetical protein